MFIIVAIAITIPYAVLQNIPVGFRCLCRISWSRMGKCGDVNTYIEWYHQTEEVYVSKKIEVDMLLIIISFTLAKHQLTSQVSFGGERTLVESLTTPTYVPWTEVSNRRSLCIKADFEMDMLLSFTLAKHQLTSQVSFGGGERTLVESLTTPTYVGTSYYTTHTHVWQSTLYLEASLPPCLLLKFSKLLYSNSPI